MQTSKQLFPAINNLYSLGFTKEEVEKLCSFPESLVNKEKDDKTETLDQTRENQRGSTETTYEELIRNLSILVRAKTSMASASGKSTYDSKEIEFFKIDSKTTDEDEEREEGSELLLRKAKTHGFVLGANNYANSISREKDGIIFKRLTKNSLAKLELFRKILTFVKHDNSSLFPINFFQKRAFTTVTELYSYLRTSFLENHEDANRFLNTYVKIDGSYNGHSNNYCDILTAFLKKVFPKIKHTRFNYEAKKHQATFDIYSSSKYLRLITDVFETDNSRFFLTMAPSGNRSYIYNNDSTTTNFRLQVIPHTNPMYDYIDAGRLFLSKNKGVNHHGYESEPFLGSAVLTEREPVLPRDFVLEDYLNRLPAGAQEVLDTNDLLLLTKRHEQRASRAEEEGKQKEKLKAKIKEKIKVLDEGGKLTINEVTYTKDFISYEDQKLTFDIPDDVKDPEVKNWAHTILVKATDYHDLDRVTFDNVLGRFLDYLASKQDYSRYSKMFIKDETTSWKTLRGTIGDVAFKIEIRTLTNSDGISSERTYINGYRINREEVRACVERGLCFEKQSDFDYFLKEVSKCSLKFHRYLQTGVDIAPYDNFEQAQLSIKLVIERRKNLNYLSVADKLYKIKDTQKIIKLQNSRDLMDVVNVLMNSAIVEGVLIDDIKVVIDGAKKAYTTAIEKSKELLKHAETMFNIQVAKHTMTNGNTIEGYLINGQTRSYVLEIKEGSDGRNGVYDYPSGNYICIVDKSKSQVGADKVVNRIYALHNDSRLATQISTL